MYCMIFREKSSPQAPKILLYFNRGPWAAPWGEAHGSTRRRFALYYLQREELATGAENATMLQQGPLLQYSKIFGACGELVSLKII